MAPPPENQLIEPEKGPSEKDKHLQVAPIFRFMGP